MDAKREKQGGSAPVSEHLSSAKVAAGFGVAGMFLNMTACCTSVLGLGGGLILGAVGLFMGYSINAQRPDPESRAFAQMAMITGGFSLFWGVLIGTLIVLYLMFNVAIFMAAWSFS